jgi:ribosomal protein L37AE/L43A
MEKQKMSNLREDVIDFFIGYKVGHLVSFSQLMELSRYKITRTQSQQVISKDNWTSWGNYSWSNREQIFLLVNGKWRNRKCQICARMSLTRFSSQYENWRCNYCLSKSCGITQWVKNNMPDINSPQYRTCHTQ